MIQLLQSQIECWKCGEMTGVYTWIGHELWSLVKPDIDLPVTVYLCASSVVDRQYWANHCEHCGVIQGDWYLFCEPPFLVWCTLDGEIVEI